VAGPVQVLENHAKRALRTKVCDNACEGVQQSFAGTIVTRGVEVFQRGGDAVEFRENGCERSPNRLLDLPRPNTRQRSPQSAYDGLIWCAFGIRGVADEGLTALIAHERDKLADET
jgi:hypothetical protein